MSSCIRDLQVETVSVSTLKPYARNARTHSKKQLRQIAASIKQFGFTNPILTDAGGGIIAGHARVEAAKQTVWYTGGCKSWYLDAEGIPASWPWNYSRFVEEMSAPKLEHFEFA